MSAGKTCVLECSQFTLDWLILSEHQLWLHLPLLSVTHWRLVCEEAAECTAIPPSPLKASKAERRANLKSDCQGDPAAPVIGKTLRNRPATTAHFTLDTQIYSSACACLLVMSQMMTPSTQNKATVSARTGISADERHVSKPSILTSFVCKSPVCAETHHLKHSVWLLFDIRVPLSTAASFFLN